MVPEASILDNKSIGNMNFDDDDEMAGDDWVLIDFSGTRQPPTQNFSPIEAED